LHPPRLNSASYRSQDQLNSHSLNQARWRDEQPNQSAQNGLTFATDAKQVVSLSRSQSNKCKQVLLLLVSSAPLDSTSSRPTTYNIQQHAEEHYYIQVFNDNDPTHSIAACASSETATSSSTSGPRVGTGYWVLVPGSRSSKSESHIYIV
jgi:hypothetical protein